MNKEVKKQELKEKSKKKRIFEIVLTVLQIAMTLVCVIVSIFIIISPSNLAEEKEQVYEQSVKMMVVQTDSMAPTLNERDMIFGKKVDDSVKKGQTVLDLGTVITFPTRTYVKNGAGELVYVWIPNSHRVIGYGYTYQDGEETKTGYYYLKDQVVSWDQVKQEGWTFSSYVTSGDKYTLYRKNFAKDGSKLYIKNSDGTLKEANYQTIEDLNNDFRTYGVIEEDGKNIIDYSNVIENPTTIKNAYSSSGVEEIKPEDVIGYWKGTKITFLGKMISWLRDPSWHFGVIVVIPLLLLFGYNVFLIIKMIVADKQQKAVEEARKEVLTNEEEIKRKAIEEYLASLNKGPEDKAEEPLEDKQEKEE